VLNYGFSELTAFTPIWKYGTAVNLLDWVQKDFLNIFALLQNFRNSNRSRDIELFLEKCSKIFKLLYLGYFLGYSDRKNVKMLVLNRSLTYRNHISRCVGLVGLIQH